MARLLKSSITVLMILSIGMVVITGVNGSLSRSSMKKIVQINKHGPFIGIAVPNTFEMNPLIKSPSFVPRHRLPYLDISGKRFRFGVIANRKVIVVMTGSGMLNAGLTTQLLLTLFDIEGLLHYGIAGNADSNLQIGDVTIPRYWAHSGLWQWQRYGDGAEDELTGGYTKEYGYIDISEYGNGTNLLNNVWYLPEEIFPVDDAPEVRQYAFWVPVDSTYYTLSLKLEGLNLTRCINNETSCLPRSPMVVRVERGVTANVFLDNSAYRGFLYNKFNATAIDMETAAIALVSHQQRVPFIAMRSLSDLAGGGSADEADTFAALAAQNAIDAVLKFISLLV